MTEEVEAGGPGASVALDGLVRLDGRVALVTGAAGGIGSEAARLFAAAGAKLVLCDSDGDAATRVANDVESAGGEALGLRVDVRRGTEVEAAIAQGVERFGGLHVLFNNAGIFPGEDGSPVDTPEDVWDRVIDVNLKGVFLGCKFGIPAMQASGGGSIINTASFVAVMGAATSQVAYTASKGGVLAMTREIAVEFAPQGIRANALCPGPVDTPLVAELLRDPSARARRFAHIPMGRLATASEVARAALFLASPLSSYVNGTTFLVDGGITGAYVTAEGGSPT